MTTTSINPRDALRNAIAERDTAKERLGVAAEVVERAKAQVAEADTKLRALGDVDAAILKHRAASFKSAAKGGPKPSLALPAELLKREKARDETASEAQAARAAHADLVGQFAEAQAALRSAEWKVTELASKVLVAETIDQGEALIEIWASLWAKIDSLKALSSSGVKLPIEILNVVRGFDAQDHRQFAGGRNPQLARATQYWQRYRAALSNSADATGPEPIDDGASSAAERAA
jgi:hypothetical protein